MVTENGHQYRLKKRKCHFRRQFGGLTDDVSLKLDISTVKYQKKYFMYLVNVGVGQKMGLMLVLLYVVIYHLSFN